MYIQYNLSDGDIVNIQATNSEPANQAELQALGRGQMKVADNINVLSQVNIKTGYVYPYQPVSNYQFETNLLKPAGL